MPDPITLELVNSKQMAATNDSVYVLDENGIVWRYSHLSGTWSRLPDIPKPEAPVG